MLILNELSCYLSENECEFEFIHHEKPMRTVEEGSKYFDIEAIAPTLVVQTEKGLYAVIVSAKRGRVNFGDLKRDLGFEKMKMADREKVFEETGFRAGSIPFFGHGLSVIFDRTLLALPYIYGGTGDELVTLKISPKDVIRLSNMAGWLE